MISINANIGLLNPVDLSALPDEKTALAIRHLNLFYGNTQALFDINMRIPKGKVTAFIGRRAAVNPPCCAVSTV